MKKLLFLLAILFSHLVEASFNIDVGPHFHYTQIEFDSPKDLQGYAGGVTASLDFSWYYLFSRVEFEGTWNAGPITARPCQRSAVVEYFVDGQVGGNFCFCCEQILFRPYTGFGWDRYEYEQEPDTIGLCYRYDKLFVPVGFHFDWIFCNYHSLGIQFEWRPDVDSCLKLLGIDLNTKCEQAFRVQVPIRFNYDSCCRCGFWVGVVPFYDWNKFGKVKDKNSDGVRLPIDALTRYNAGLRLLFGWEF